jgi:hypothetical protein
MDRLWRSDFGRRWWRGGSGEEKVDKEMPGVYRLTYRDGRKEEHFGHRGYYYVLSGNRLLAFLPDPVWCHTCKAITLGETHESKAEVEEELSQIDDPNSEWYRTRRREPLAEDIAFFRRRLNNLLVLWQERTSAPKCLKCFHSTVSKFVWNKWAAHPGTGEEVLYQCVGMCSTDFAMRFFTVDCEELSLSEEKENAFGEMIRRGENL